jgi:hypothetical protein
MANSKKLLALNALDVERDHCWQQVADTCKLQLSSCPPSLAVETNLIKVFGVGTV